MKKLKIIAVIMSILAVFYIIGIFMIPSMQILKSDLIAWMFFGLYVLILFFIWGLSKGHRYEKISKDENDVLDDTKEVLKERSKWYR